ncbi:MAG: carbohydrate kinase family protein [Acidimicrobiales bacterium]
MTPTVVAVGDLMTDIVVELGGPIALGTDTRARITHRRGGAAANFAVAAAGLGAHVRFVANVGDDADGRALEDALRAADVEPRLSRGGRTGTIVVLVDDSGERTMLNDRASASELAELPAGLLDEADALALTGYSFLADPERETVTALAASALAAGIPVIVDIASAGAVATLGVDEFLTRLAAVAPTVVHCNEDEAQLVATVQPVRELAGTVVVHRGDAPAMVHRGVDSTGVPPLVVEHVTDSTGAGDAFVAGWSVAFLNGADALDATRSGHAAAAAHLHRQETSRAPR